MGSLCLPSIALYLFTTLRSIVHPHCHQFPFGNKLLTVARSKRRFLDYRTQKFKDPSACPTSTMGFNRQSAEVDQNTPGSLTYFHHQLASLSPDVEYIECLHFVVAWSPHSTKTNMPLLKAHRVLGIPELLHEIFSCLGDASNARNARVCAQWHEIALDSLWCHAEGLYHLFSRLSPMEEIDDRCVSLTMVPT